MQRYIFTHMIHVIPYKMKVLMLLFIIGLVI